MSVLLIIGLNKFYHKYFWYDDFPSVVCFCNFDSVLAMSGSFYCILVNLSRNRGSTWYVPMTHITIFLSESDGKGYNGKGQIIGDYIIFALYMNNFKNVFLYRHYCAKRLFNGWLVLKKCGSVVWNTIANAFSSVIKYLVSTDVSLWNENPNVRCSSLGPLWNNSSPMAYAKTSVRKMNRYFKFG